MHDFTLRNHKPSPLILFTSLASVVIVLTVAVSSIQRDNSGSIESGGPDVGMTQFAQTLSAMTPDLTVAAESDADATRIAVTMQALSADPTEPPAQALATAHAEFEVADRLDGVQRALDILQTLQPSDPEPYESYILAAAELAAESAIPFPFSGTVDLPDPEDDISAYQEAVYTEDFIAACDMDSVIPYEVCARDAFIDFPMFTRALSAVNPSDAIPMARTALQSPNKLIVDSAIHVLCAHQDLDSIPIMEARIEALDWPLPDMSAASSLLACGDEEADVLALELLEGDEPLFNAMREQVQALYGP